MSGDTGEREPDAIDALLRLLMAVVALLAVLTLKAWFWWELLTNA